MHKSIISALLLFYLSIAQADELIANCVKARYNPREFSSFDLFYSKVPYKAANCISTKDRRVKLDEEAWLLIKKKSPDLFLRIATAFNLVGDSKEEFIVQGNQASGGTNFYILEKQKRKWKIILEFTGGFILRNEEAGNGRLNKSKIDNDAYKIVSWGRVGADETWQTEYVYSNGKYVVQSSQLVPLSLLHQKNFLDLMVKLNGWNVPWS